MMVRAGPGRPSSSAPALVFGGVLAGGLLPFLIADPEAFYDDTIRYGAGTYRIVGYGLSAILVRARDPRRPRRAPTRSRCSPCSPGCRSPSGSCSRSAGRQELWFGAAGFAVSILWLMFIGRTFNNYYLVWPMTGAVIAALMAVDSARAPDRPRPG